MAHAHGSWHIAHGSWHMAHGSCYSGPPLVARENPRVLEWKRRSKLYSFISGYSQAKLHNKAFSLKTLTRLDLAKNAKSQKPLQLSTFKF